MADEQQRHEAPRSRDDLPATPEPETRAETIARVVDEAEAAGAERGGSPDPSTRRGVHRTLTGTLLAAAGAGAVVGAIAGLVLGLWPSGPQEDGRGIGIQGEGLGHHIGYVVVMAIAVAIVFAAIAAFLTLAREDGRIEREVEERTGRGPEGPGRPGDPRRDLTPR